ncbi:MAG: hypothetical protein GKS01_19125 [Alphaproteobacteria bacterium]|nr:hypothetical protein [Alphaproteobacteria bacterium]
MYSLYFCPGTCSMAAHILLEECGAEYETIAIALGKGEQRGEAYRKINPHGKVPALDVGGEIITQNVAILPYICRAFPDANMAPADSAELARCVETAGWLTSVVHPAFALALHPERPGGETSLGDDAEKAIEDAARATYWAAMEEIDRRLSDQQWMMGDQYTFLDGYALVFYGWGKRINMPMENLKSFTSFKDRMIDRPAVRKILEKENSPLLAAA